METEMQLSVLHFISLSIIGGIERQFQRFITYVDAHRADFPDTAHSVLSYHPRIHGDIITTVRSACRNIHVFKKLFPDILCPPLIRTKRVTSLFSAHDYNVLITTSMLRNRIQKKVISRFPGLNIFYDKGWCTSADPREDLTMFNGFIANSSSTKHTLLKKFDLDPDSIRILHNSFPDTFIGIDTEQARQAVRKRFNITESDSLVLGLGRFRYLKGFTVLVETMKHIKDPSVKCILAGSGRTEPAVKQLAREYGLSDRVIFAGHTDNPGEFYAASDVFVLPSCREPFGIVLLEAGASRTPVIANRIDGVLDTVCDDRYGFLVPPETPPSDFPYIPAGSIPETVYYPDRDELSPPLFPDPEKLAETIMYVLSHPEEADTRSENLYNRIQEKFSTKSYAENLHRIIREFL